MSLLHQWINDPGASSAIAIALVAGTWAVAQFRPIARERRRETYEAMTTHYVELRPARDAAVPHFPPLLRAAQQRVLAATEQPQCNTEAGYRAHEVRAQIESWMRFDFAFTTAREIIDCEAKFRAMLWTVETIRQWRTDGILELNGVRYPQAVLTAAHDLAHDLNAFLFHYETGSYPARQTLGLLHRSLAVVSKATEPVVWEASLDARWGRRVLRIGIACQHFNDVTPIHCISDMTWKTVEGTRRLVHPRLKRTVSGASVLEGNSPIRPRLLPGPRIRIRAFMWYLVGLVSPNPRIWFLSYGGRRLHLHRRSENQVAGLMKLAITPDERQAQTASERDTELMVSLDFTWSLTDLKERQRQILRNQRKAQGRLAWLWFPRRAEYSTDGS
ncbi:MAG TPA: hypothetical protein VIJ39_07095 [Solirubrobacteraceae bacterium]